MSEENKRFFNCGSHSLELSSRTLVMGILNVTPDSFSDGGLYLSPNKAITHALELRSDGADIVDIGAMSTAPGVAAVSPDEEIRRLSPVLAELCEQLDCPVSIDTVNAETAEYAVNAGVSIINDVSGSFNPRIAALAAERGVGLIVTHGGKADGVGDCSRDIVSEVSSFFSKVSLAAEVSGIERSRLCLDVGIGFGKSRDEDAEVLRRLSQVDKCGCAMLVGASRKRIIGEACGIDEPAHRDPGSVAAHTAAIAGGADIIRAHNVPFAVQGTMTADAVFRRLGSRSKQNDYIIEIRGLRIFAYHGVNPEEKRDGQYFVIDLDAHVPFCDACASDDLRDTVNYAALVKCIRAAMTAEKYDLIERTAQAVADSVLSGFHAISELSLTLKKPEAPIKADFDYVGVRLHRFRKDC